MAVVQQAQASAATSPSELPHGAHFASAPSAPFPLQELAITAEPGGQGRKSWDFLHSTLPSCSEKEPPTRLPPGEADEAGAGLPYMI